MDEEPQLKGRWFMKYEEPNIEIITLLQDDLVRTSGGLENKNDPDTGPW